MNMMDREKLRTQITRLARIASYYAETHRMVKAHWAMDQALRLRVQLRQLEKRNATAQI